MTAPITPTIGRKVWLFISAEGHRDSLGMVRRQDAVSPMDASIAYVHPEKPGHDYRYVTVSFADHCGAMRAAVVPLRQPGQPKPDAREWVEWMPYQVKTAEAATPAQDDSSKVSRYGPGDLVLFQPNAEAIDALNRLSFAPGIPAKVVGVEFAPGKVLYDLALYEGDSVGTYYEAFPLRKVDSFFVLDRAAGIKWGPSGHADSDLRSIIERAMAVLSELPPSFNMVVNRAFNILREAHVDAEPARREVPEEEMGPGAALATRNEHLELPPYDRREVTIQMMLHASASHIAANPTMAAEIGAAIAKAADAGFQLQAEGDTSQRLTALENGLATESTVRASTDAALRSQIYGAAQ